MKPFHKIYNCYCEQGIPAIPDSSVDLVITSPVYNVDLGNNKYNKNPYDLYKDNKDHKEYIQWLVEIFGLIYPKLKPGGRVCLNIGDGKNGRVPTHSDLIQELTKTLKYIPMQMIVWDKNQTSNRTAWGSYLSPSMPSLPMTFEYILIFSKESLRLPVRGETDLTKDEFVQWTNPIWRMKPETRQKQLGSVGAFPEELPKRCIKLFSWIGAVVLDPFAGSHTTGVMCKKLNRSYIGFEISKGYCEIGQRRIAEAKPDRRSKRRKA